MEGRAAARARAGWCAPRRQRRTRRGRADWNRATTTRRAASHARVVAEAERAGAMIALTTDSALLRRFALDLDRTSPRPMPSAPDLSRYADDELAVARAAWAFRIVDEYRSVAVFSELLHLLADLEAPYPALCAVQRIIGDELRHTQLCATVVEWLRPRASDDTALAIDLADIGLPPRDADEPAAERARRIIARELVVAEEESVYVLTAYRDATTEPALRAVLDIVLADEVRHAAAGRALLALFETDHVFDHELDADRAELRAIYRASARDAGSTRDTGSTCGGAGRALGASIEQADLDS